jgi:hypothetical protein
MLEALISSKTRIKLLLKFFLNNKNTAYLRSLEEEFGESTNAIRIELNRFEEAGFLTSSAEGNKKIFTVNTKHPFYKDLNSLIMKMTGLEYVVDYVTQRLGNLHKVYLVGNLAKGQDTEIIDLVLVGENINKTFLLEQIDKAEKKIGKKVRYVLFSPSEFKKSKIEEPGMHPLLIWYK